MATRNEMHGALEAYLGGNKEPLLQILHDAGGGSAILTEGGLAASKISDMQVFDPAKADGSEMLVVSCHGYNARMPLASLSSGGSSDLEARVAALEALYIPVVTNAALYFPLSSIGGDALVQMTSTGAAPPTGWTITSETLNDQPTTGYWEIDNSGNIYCDQPGALKVNDMAAINVRASNDFGSGDGFCTIGITA